jgi:hypothetical protein
MSQFAVTEILVTDYSIIFVKCKNSTVWPSQVKIEKAAFYYKSK